MYYRVLAGSYEPLNCSASRRGSRTKHGPLRLQLTQAIPPNPPKGNRRLTPSIVNPFALLPCLRRHIYGLTGRVY